jgi:serine/threonine protein kinase
MWITSAVTVRKGHRLNISLFDIKAMFREFDIWRRAQHVNVVSLLGFVVEGDGVPGLVSPWCKSGSLRSYVKANPEADRKALVRQIALLFCWAD